MRQMVDKVLNRRFGATILLVVCLQSVFAMSLHAAEEWKPVTGAEQLRAFMSDVTIEWSGGDRGKTRGEYRADGTGTLYSWRAPLERRWEIVGQDTIRVSGLGVSVDYTLEQSSTDANRYRVKDARNGEVAVVHRMEGTSSAVVEGKPVAPRGAGGAAAPSADEMAAQLSNPNSPVAVLNLKNQFRSFEGDLPGADSQTSYTMLFQPVLPFPLDNGDLIFWRPALPFIVDQPVFNAETGGFDDISGVGDLAMDLAYAPKMEGGVIFGLGLFTVLPTGADRLSPNRLTLGPEFVLGKATPKAVYGIFPNHQWDVGGSGDADISRTTISAFYTLLPGGGVNMGTAPIMNYDWETSQWTIPLQLNIGKTVALNGRPWKLNLEANYFVEANDAIGPEWMVGINISPVVKNALATMMGLGE